MDKLQKLDPGKPETTPADAANFQELTPLVQIGARHTGAWHRRNRQFLILATEESGPGGTAPEGTPYARARDSNRWPWA